MNLTIISAMAENRTIGRNNELIWNMPADVKRFMKLTIGHHVIMGRKTYESVMKPLPKRTNIIVTRQKDYKAEDCMIVNDLETAIRKAEDDTQPFIIGGAQIYELALPYVNIIELTVIRHEFEGDAFFPDFDETKWLLHKEENYPDDSINPYPFSFKTYIKTYIKSCSLA